MFANEIYSLSQLVAKLGLPAEQVEIGLRRTGAHAVPNNHLYTYETVWNYVHRYVNHMHFAAWEHQIERVNASQMTPDLVNRITAGWSESAIEALTRVLKSADGSNEVCFMLHRILRIDPECPTCGRFPWIVGYDGRQARAGAILSMYVCPGCGYFFLKR